MLYKYATFSLWVSHFGFSAQHVKPFVKGNKNDRNDALAICEASQRPNVHFTTIKPIELQDIQMLHRIRQRNVQAGTAISNQIRSYLHEYGITIAKQIRHVLHEVPLILEDSDNGLSELARQLLNNLFRDLLEHRKKVEVNNQQLKQWISTRDDCQRLLALPGYGPIVTTALLAAVGNGSQFRKGRQMSAWVGLAPRHIGTGGHNIVLSTRKMGNNYLRTLLIHGARTVVTWSKHKDDPLSHWIQQMVVRQGKPKTYVALANKLTRVAWCILQGQEYEANKIAAPFTSSNRKVIQVQMVTNPARCKKMS